MAFQSKFSDFAMSQKFTKSFSVYRSKKLDSPFDKDPSGFSLYKYDSMIGSESPTIAPALYTLQSKESEENKEETPNRSRYVLRLGAKKDSLKEVSHETSSQKSKVFF